MGAGIGERGCVGWRRGALWASSLGEGTSKHRRVGPLCMHTENACRTSVICNIISASTMTAMRESTPQGREGKGGEGRQHVCLKEGLFFFFLVLIRKYNEPLKKQEKKKKRSLLRLMENKLIWWFGFNYYFSISSPMQRQGQPSAVRSEELCLHLLIFAQTHSGNTDSSALLPTRSTMWASINTRSFQQLWDV